jgi:4-hydroxy-tetrahydrodipicolinate synthase
VAGVNHGVWCAVVTPFDGESIAGSRLAQHLDVLMASGVHGLIVAGSSGEGHLLARAERQHLLDATLSHVNGRAPVMVGASLPSTQETVALVRAAARAGAAGMLLTPPYYYRPTLDELRRYLGAACEAADLPAMLYNTPEATGTDVTPEMLSEILRAVPLAAVKESSGTLGRIPEILLGSPQLAVFVGTDSIALPGLRAGAAGWVTGAANIIPRESVELYEMARRDPEAAERLFERLRPLCAFLEECGRYVPCLKAGAAMRGWSVGDPRPPLLPLEPTLAAELRRHLALATSESGRPLTV